MIKWWKKRKENKKKKDNDKEGVDVIAVIAEFLFSIFD